MERDERGYREGTIKKERELEEGRE